MVVEIEWLDVFSGVQEASIESAAKNKPILSRSIGYLIAENEHGLTLVSDQWPEHPGVGLIESFVPHCMIKQWWIYS